MTNVPQSNGGLKSSNPGLDATAMKLGVWGVVGVCGLLGATDAIKNLKFPPSKEMAIPVPQGSWDCPCGARSSARRRPSWDSLPRKKMLVSALSITCFVPGRAAVRIADLIFDRRIVFLNTDIIG